ncbi:MAG TPA: hypothetical protein VGO49_16095 [Bradyrhizobium sp.]|jgi:hypothetical protein|nr:hypothetical protein [Bradyrhizobium sp.]
MELRNVIFGQAIQFIESSEGERRISPVPLIRAMQDRYGFVQVPQKVAELDFNAGVNFLQGYFKDIVIDKFQVYNNGLLCEAAADNEVCAEFLDEVLTWASKEFNLPLKPRMKAFQSKIEAFSTKDIGRTFANFNEVGALITRLLEGYGLNAPPYVIWGLALQHEPQKDVPSNPSFEFARRAEQPFDSGIYYSSAPLRTQDHLQVLNLLEQVL